jgi:hypothetical protein
VLCVVKVGEHGFATDCHHQQNTRTILSLPGPATTGPTSLTGVPATVVKVVDQTSFSATVAYNDDTQNNKRNNHKQWIFFGSQRRFRKLAGVELCSIPHLSRPSSSDPSHPLNHRKTSISIVQRRQTSRRQLEKPTTIIEKNVTKQQSQRLARLKSQHNNNQSIEISKFHVKSIIQ